MSRKDRITEAELHAYVDGALDGPDRKTVEDYLAANPARTEEVEAWRRQNDALQALYGHVSAEEVPPRLDVRRMAGDIRVGKGNWRRMAAAAILFFVVGGLGGWMLRGLDLSETPRQRNLVTEAVAAHNLYSVEVIHPVEVRAEQKDHLQTWLSKRLDRVIRVPDLTGEGFEFVGGRLLPADQGPAAQLMYEDPSGHRVTLFIVPTVDGRDTAFRYVASDPLEAFFWSEETLSCALVGDLGRSRLQEIAIRAYEQLG